MSMQAIMGTYVLHEHTFPCQAPANLVLGRRILARFWQVRLTQVAEPHAAGLDDLAPDPERQRLGRLDVTAVLAEHVQRVEIGHACVGILRRHRAATDIAADNDHRVADADTRPSHPSSACGGTPSMPKSMRNRRPSTLIDAGSVGERAERRGADERDAGAPSLGRCRLLAAPRRTSRSGRPASSDSASDHGPTTIRPLTARPKKSVVTASPAPTSPSDQTRRPESAARASRLWSS